MFMKLTCVSEDWTVGKRMSVANVYLARALALTVCVTLLAGPGLAASASSKIEYLEARPLEDGELFDFEAAPRPRDMYTLLHADNSMVCPTFLEALNDNSDRVAATPGDAGSRAANMFGTHYSVEWPFVMGETGKNGYVDFDIDNDGQEEALIRHTFRLGDNLSQNLFLFTIPFEYNELDEISPVNNFFRYLAENGDTWSNPSVMSRETKAITSYRRLVTPGPKVPKQFGRLVNLAKLDGVSYVILGTSSMGSDDPLSPVWVLEGSLNSGPLSEAYGPVQYDAVCAFMPKYYHKAQQPSD